MAKHVTEKELLYTKREISNIIGNLNDIKYLDDNSCKNLVEVINILIERIMILEGNSPNANTIARSNNVLPVDGIKI